MASSICFTKVAGGREVGLLGRSFQGYLKRLGLVFPSSDTLLRPSSPPPRSSPAGRASAGEVPPPAGVFRIRASAAPQFPYSDRWPARAWDWAFHHREDRWLTGIRAPVKPRPPSAMFFNGGHVACGSSRARSSWPAARSLWSVSLGTGSWKPSSSFQRFTNVSSRSAISSKVTPEPVSSRVSISST